MRRFVAALLTVALLFSASGTARASAILFVTDDAIIPGGADVAVMTYLGTLGHTVTSVSDDASSAADAVGMDLVIISSTVGSGNVGTKFTDQNPDFRNLFIPTINWENALTDEFHFSDDDDAIADQDTITITAEGAAHPMFAGLGFVAGQDIKVYNALDSLHTVDMHADENPAPGATMLGIPKDNTRPNGAIVVVEGGGELNNANLASARRIGFFFDSDSFDKSYDAGDPTVRGRELFDAALTYSLETPYTDTFTWEAVGNGDWAEGTKWDPDAGAGLPDGTSRVLIDKPVVVTTAADASAFSLEMAAGSQLWVGENATLNVVRDLQAGASGTFVVLAGNNAQLTTGWGGTNIDTLMTDVAGVGTITFDTQGAAVVNIFSDEGDALNTRTFVKKGPSTLTLDNTIPGSVAAANTTFRIEEGTLASSGADPLGGATRVELAGVGATLSLALEPGLAPLAHYSFDAIGGPGNEDSGSGYDLTLKDGAVFTDAPIAPKFGAGALTFDGNDAEATTTAENPVLVEDVHARLEAEFIQEIGEKAYVRLLENVYAVTDIDADPLLVDLQATKLFAARTGLWERDTAVWQRIQETAPPEAKALASRFESYGAFMSAVINKGVEQLGATSTLVGEQLLDQVRLQASRIPLVKTIQGFMTQGRKTFEQNYIAREFQNDPDALQDILRFGYIALDEAERTAVDRAYTLLSQAS